MDGRFSDRHSALRGPAALTRRRALQAAFASLALIPPVRVPPRTAAEAATLVSSTGDFAGLVDIGGRSLYLECRGQGSPTVILEAGAYGRSDVWSRDTLHPAGVRTMVLPGVAEFTRVCAYDRPGTMGEVNPDLDPYGPLFFPSRSDPVPQPRTPRDLVADLHALLRAADVPGPYCTIRQPVGASSPS